MTPATTLVTHLAINQNRRGVVVGFNGGLAQVSVNGSIQNVPAGSLKLHDSVIVAQNVATKVGKNYIEIEV